MASKISSPPLSCRWRILIKYLVACLLKVACQKNISGTIGEAHTSRYETVRILHVICTRSTYTTAGLPVSYRLGPRWYFCYWGQILIPRPALDSAAQTTRGMLLDFFVKPQNSLVWLVTASGRWCFPGGFRHKTGPLSSNGFFSKSEAYYDRNFSSLNKTFEKKRTKQYFVLNYCWYLQARYYRAHANQLDFLKN